MTFSPLPHRKVGRVSPEVRLLQDYACDVERWIAYPADPRWTYWKAGETYWATEDEAEYLLARGIAEKIE